MRYVAPLKIGVMDENTISAGLPKTRGCRYNMDNGLGRGAQSGGRGVRESLCSVSTKSGALGREKVLHER